jgi:hypothetical protein
MRRRAMRRYVKFRELLRRIASLEMLNEVEEVELVLNHYAISWRVRFTDRNGCEGSDTSRLVRKDRLWNYGDCG